MNLLVSILILIFSYILGSIPTGLIIVRVTTGQDIRKVASGRTGGTNVMRAAGVWAGLATAFIDILKALVCVYLARFILPGSVWTEVLAPVMAVIGHNYSIFLAERDEEGTLRLRGGAGGAPTVGGAAGLWFPVLLILTPIGLSIFYFIGYASVATMSVPVITTLVFAYQAYRGYLPWEWSVYGLLTGILLAWALRPNFRRLMEGNERLVGYRARKKTKSPSDAANPPP
jgi:glycerol-3-phosphate acyltransferase PlsY